MQYTENCSFKMPDGADKVSVKDLNDNFDSIDGYIGSNRTRLDIVETLCDELRDDVNELMSSGGTGGGGVTPAIYVLQDYEVTINYVKWHIRKWSNNYMECWCRVYPSNNISCDWKMTNNKYYGWFSVTFPDEFLTDPEFISVTPRTTYQVTCGVGGVAFDTKNLTISVIDNEQGNEEETELISSNCSFYIEMRGKCIFG